MVGFVTVPRPVVLEAFEGVATAGISNAVVLTSGYPAGRRGWPQGFPDAITAEFSEAVVRIASSTSAQLDWLRISRKDQGRW